MVSPIQSPALAIARAAQAYAGTANGSPSMGVGPGPGVGKSSPGGEFADLVKGALEEARRIGDRSEAMSVQGINGRAELNEVVTAVAEAELTLQTVVAIRDKVLEAYKDIIRMPI